MTEPCPLCHVSRAEPFETVGGRGFLACEECGLVFVERRALPSPQAERAHYDLHQNSPADPAYRRFLSQLTDPLVTRLTAGAEGLDYGCGPGPAVGAMLAERGLKVRDYDPIFAPDAQALARDYDFIVCTEVAEHFHEPGEAFRELGRLLRPGGWLGVMTSLLTPEIEFGRWGYVRDPTHVAFYRPRTLAWIAARMGWALDTDERRVALFRKAGVRAEDSARVWDREVVRGETG